MNTPEENPATATTESTPTPTQTPEKTSAPVLDAGEEMAKTQTSDLATAPSPEEKPAPQPTTQKSNFTPVDLSNGKPQAPQVHSPAEKLAMEEAAKYGRVDAEGRVFVNDAGVEREVGQYPDEVPAQPFALYVRRFLDLQAQVDLAQARMPGLKANEIDSTLHSLDKALEAPMAVGNLEGLRQRVAALRESGQARKEKLAQLREEAKAKTLALRTSIVEGAEKIASQDPHRTQWKQSGTRLRELLDQWKESQRKGPHIDRATEDALWKRFSAARTAFDRHRKQYFSNLDAKQAEVKAKKEALIARAKELATSTDWARTSALYRELMNEWKAAGQASRKDDNSLWERFREAQQGFFDARQAANQQADQDEAASLAAKEKLLEQAKALLPIKNLDTAKATFRDLLDKWDEAGRVPRSEVSRLESGLRSVEQAIANAEQEEWNKSNPETKARAEGLVGQLEEKIAQLEEQIAAAKAQGKDTKSLEDDLAARQAWLAQARKTAAE